MELGLEGKVALVAGASRGIGLATARQLHAEGAAVAMVGRDHETLASAARVVGAGAPSERIELITADVSGPGQASQVVERTEARWGHLDILVVSVGHGVRSTLASPFSTWEQNWRTNLVPAVTLCHAASPAMQRNRGGRVILLAAASGIQPTPGQLVSNVYKAGVIALGRSLAGELASSGIRVNVVCPGRILTERRARRAQEDAEASGETQEQHLAKVAASIPLGQWGNPDHVAALIVFLCSGPAEYITGQVIAVDGGLV